MHQRYIPRNITRVDCSQVCETNGKESLGQSFATFRSPRHPPPARANAHARARPRRNEQRWSSPDRPRGEPGCPLYRVWVGRDARQVEGLSHCRACPVDALGVLADVGPQVTPKCRERVGGIRICRVSRHISARHVGRLVAVVTGARRCGRGDHWPGSSSSWSGVTVSTARTAG